MDPPLKYLQSPLINLRRNFLIQKEIATQSNFNSMPFTPCNHLFLADLVRSSSSCSASVLKEAVPGTGTEDAEGGRDGVWLS